MSKADRVRRQRRQTSTAPDPTPTLLRLRAWHEALPWDSTEPGGMAWHGDPLLVSPQEAAEAGHTLSHAGRVSDGCWACWRYTAEAMAALVADEPIPPAPAHWEKYVRCWYSEAFDGG